MSKFLMTEDRRRETRLLLFVLALIVLHVCAATGAFVAQMPEYSADGRPFVLFFLALIVALCVDTSLALRAVARAKTWTLRGGFGVITCLLAVSVGWLSANQATVMREVMHTVTSPATMNREGFLGAIRECRVERIVGGQQLLEVTFRGSYLHSDGYRYTSKTNYASTADWDSAKVVADEVNDRCVISFEKTSPPER